VFNFFFLFLLLCACHRISANKRFSNPQLLSLTFEFPAPAITAIRFFLSLTCLFLPGPVDLALPFSFLQTTGSVARCEHHSEPLPEAEIELHALIS